MSFMYICTYLYVCKFYGTSCTQQLADLNAAWDCQLSCLHVYQYGGGGGATKGKSSTVNVHVHVYLK